MNILTFDVEEWFHLLDCNDTKGEAEWVTFEPRIYKNVDRILNILETTNTKATFFIIGWIARQYPDVVKKIAELYEIASHTDAHQLVYDQTPDEFRNDLLSSVHRLEDLTGQKVRYFRAPGFSITTKNLWAFDVLNECGIELDCSVFPSHHSHGGIPEYGKGEPGIIEHNGRRIKEFPISTKEIFGKNIIFSGGGYFRLVPYCLIKRWLKQNDYNLSYIHPRDLDPDQPMIRSLSLARKFKSYIGLQEAEHKLRKMLTAFEFTDIATAEKNINWNEVKVIKL